MNRKAVPLIILLGVFSAFLLHLILPFGMWNALKMSKKTKKDPELTVARYIL